MGQVIIAGKAFSVDAPVVNWFESGWNAQLESGIPLRGMGRAQVQALPTGVTRRGLRRYSLRPALRRFGTTPPLDAVKASIRQFIIHHDGCASAEMCFDVLHNERGLSCHFLIDNDGTIYQTLDLGLMAWHAALYNAQSIGVEISSRGDAKKDPGFYNGRKGPRRTTTACTINGHTYLAYQFTDAQYQAFTALAKGLTRLLPNLPVEYPQRAAGQQSWDTMPFGSGYAGYLGHYHCTTAKWDPGPFDLKAFCHKLRGAFCFPLWTGEKKPDAAPEIPSRSDELKARTIELYRANEARAEGGFFPLAPWGGSHLWHGGVHLRGTKGQAIYAPFPGRIVAARSGPSTEIGSTNFVLLRHDLTLGPKSLRFFTLLMHLARPDGETTPAWLAGSNTDVRLLDEPVEAGTRIGSMGVAGPDDLAAAQLHIAVFSTTPYFAGEPSTPWEVIDGTAGGRYCEVPEILAAVPDTNRDGAWSADEVRAAWQGGAAEQFRHFITLHVSEWTAAPSWIDTLRSSKDFAELSADDVATLVNEQITPGLWWTDAVARHAGLPLDGVVYHYHPAAFVRWVNEKLIEAAAAPAPVVDASRAAVAPQGVTDDFGDVDGTSAVADSETDDDTCDKQLGLEQLVMGFDAPECP